MKRTYPNEIEHTEWMRRQNYFLEEQNKTLKKKLQHINSSYYYQTTLEN